MKNTNNAPVRLLILHAASIEEILDHSLTFRHCLVNYKHFTLVLLIQFCIIWKFPTVKLMYGTFLPKFILHIIRSNLASVAGVKRRRRGAGESGDGRRGDWEILPRPSSRFSPLLPLLRLHLQQLSHCCLCQSTATSSLVQLLLFYIVYRVL